MHDLVGVALPLLEVGDLRQVSQVKINIHNPHRQGQVLLCLKFPFSDAWN